MNTTHTLKKRLLSILLTATMLMSNIAQPFPAVAADLDTPEPAAETETIVEEVDPIAEEINPTAEGDTPVTNWQKDHNVTITIGKTDYTPDSSNINYTEGDEITAKFEWAVEDGVPLPKEYNYSLGDYRLKNDYKGGPVVDTNNQTVGSWTVVHSDEDDGDIIRFNFEDWFCSEHATSRSFWVRLTGTIPLEPPENADANRDSFQIGDEWFNLNTKYKSGKVDLDKQMTNCRFDVDGKLRYDVEIKATVTGYIKELKLNDQLTRPNKDKDNQDDSFSSNPAWFSMDGLTVQLNNKNLVANTDYIVGNYDNTAPPWNFSLDFKNMTFKSNDVITVKYTLIMDATALKPNQDYFPDNNNVDGTFIDIPTDGTQTITPKKAPFELGKLNLKLEKSGDYDPNELDTINWTLTIDTGITASAASTNPDADIKTRLVDILEKNYPKLNLKDTVGNAADHDLNPSFKSNLGNSDYFYRAILRSDATKVVAKEVIENGKKSFRWFLIYTYSTTIKNKENARKYDNTAQLDNDNKTITEDGPIGIPAYDVTKSRGRSATEPVIESDGSVTMPWKIVARIPNFNFGEFTITDTTLSSSDSYKHQYKQGSLKVYVSNDGKSYSGSPEATDDPEKFPAWLKFTRKDGGFELTIDEEKFNGRHLHAKYLIILYDTEVVDSTGKKILNATSDTQFNDATRTWTNTTKINGKTDPVEDTYIYTPTKDIKPAVSKKKLVDPVLDADTGDYLFSWYVFVRNLPVATKTAEDVWIESWDDVFSIDLKDTLPVGQIFEENSLVATLCNGSGNVVENIPPELTNWLSQHLNYSYVEDDSKGNKVYNITWQSPNDDCPIDKLNEITPAGKAATYYLALQYETRLVDHTVLVHSNNNNLSFPNTVEGEVNNKEITKTSGSASVQPGQFGDKDYAYQSDWVNTGNPDDNTYFPGEEDWMYTLEENPRNPDEPILVPNMRFSIEINQPCLTASDDDRGWVVLEDTMGKKLELVDGSVRLLNNTTKDYENVDYEYTPGDKNILTLRVPGGTHYTLTYWVHVIGDEGASLSSTNDYGNSVKLSMDTNSKTFTKNPGGSKYRSSAGAEAKLTINLIKVDADTNKSIDGAKFKLEYGTIDANGKFTRADPDGTVSAKDSDGLYYTFSPTDSVLQYVFRITETKVPDGYVEGDPQYFVFANYYKTYPDNDLNKLPDYVKRITSGSAEYIFPNKHKSVTINFKGNKQITGREWNNVKDNGSYEFTLTAIKPTDAPMPTLASGGKISVVNSTNNIKFPDIKYKEEGTYKYQITEGAIAAKVKGVTKDQSTIYVTVNVTEDDTSETGLSATYYYSKDPDATKGDNTFTFTNTYKAKAATPTLTLTKNLNTNGFGIQDSYTFNFELKPDKDNSDGDPLKGESITKPITLSANNPSGTTTNFFEGLEFTQKGTYIYTLTEKEGTTTGVTYDTKVYNVKVVIDLDEENAEYTATVTIKLIDEDISNPTFDNEYKATETDAVLTVTKTFNTNGLTLENDYEFKFVLTPDGKNSDGDPLKGEPITKSVTLSGKDSSGKTENFFDGLKFTKEGTYTYTLSEKEGNTTGVTYDDTTHTVTVEITLDEATAKLKSTVKVDSEVSNNAAFTNTYKATGVGAELTAKKTFNTNGLTLAKDYEFEFVLTPVEGNPDGDPVKNSITKSVTVKSPNWEETTDNFFAGYTFSTAGTYKYTLTETDGKTTGVKYDDTKHTVTVEITLNEAEAKLKSKVTVDNTSANTAAFTNSYNAAKTGANLTVTKKLNTSLSLQKDYTFKFELISDASNNPDGDPVPKDFSKSVTLSGPEWSGSIPNIFEDLYFTKDGTYKYTLKETNENATGVTYDDKEYTVTVVITLDEANATLSCSEVTVEVDGEESDGTSFSNSYTAKEGSATLEGSKTLRNSKLKEGQFTFVLTAADGTVMEEVTNDADGHFEFSSISYTDVGEYKYTITEKNDGQSNIIYDNRVYDVTVTVTLDEDNAELVAEVKYQTTNGASADLAQFVNTYFTVSSSSEADSSSEVDDSSSETDDSSSEVDSSSTNDSSSTSDSSSKADSSSTTSGGIDSDHDQLDGNTTSGSGTSNSTTDESTTSQSNNSSSSSNTTSSSTNSQTTVTTGGGSGGSGGSSGNPTTGAQRAASTCMLLFTLTAAIAAVRSKRRDD